MVCTNRQDSGKILCFHVGHAIQNYKGVQHSLDWYSHMKERLKVIVVMKIWVPNVDQDASAI